MIDLYAIALRRAEEQVSVRGADVAWDDDWRPASAPRGIPGRPVTCECGSCHKCKNREYMRLWRAAHARPTRGGWLKELGRTCCFVSSGGEKCHETIADKNESGLCTKHRKREWDRTCRVYTKGAE